jgi:hypothetical protein
MFSELESSLDFNSLTDGREIPCPFWNMKAHYYVCKNLPLDPILWGMEPVQILAHHIFTKNIFTTTVHI